MAQKNKNLPAKNKPGAVVPVEQQMIKDAQINSGFENMGADDIAIPFIIILQALSPQVRGNSRIKGAKEGDFYNTVTGEVLGDNIKIIPCLYQKAYVEWIRREDGGGFVAQHTDSNILSQATRNENNQDMLPNGHQLVTTAYHYCLLLRGKKVERVVISLSSTQLKKSRKWNSQMMSLQIKAGNKLITPPMFSHVYTAESVEESNDLGQWMGWQFGDPEMITKPDLYNTAKKFHGDISTGLVRTAPPPDERYESDVNDNSGTYSNDNNDEEECF